MIADFFNPGRNVASVRSKILLNLIFVDNFVNVADADLTAELVGCSRVNSCHQTGVVEKRQRRLNVVHVI